MSDGDSSRPGAAAGASGWPLLSYVLDDFSEPWLDPAPVVLLHPGLGGNRELVRRWTPALADRFRVLRVDARGQGSSPLPPGYRFSLDAFVTDVVDLLDHLGIERVHWIGLSGGGIIGQHAAITAPERIASLSLVATTPRFRSPIDDVDAWLAPLDRGDVREFLLRDGERRFGAEQPERAAWIVDELARTPASTTAALHRWVLGVDLTQQLSSISCPTLVVTGERDTLTDVGDAALLARSIPDARVRVIKGRPHNVGYTEPRIVAEIVRQFLDEIARTVVDAGDQPTDSAEQARVVADTVGLDLTPERLATLDRALSDYRSRSGRLRLVDTPRVEPPVIVYDDEATK